MEKSKRWQILAVDDDPVIRQILNTVLSRDYELLLLSSGENLRPLLDGFSPDLVILDVRMPGVSGLDVCRSIRSISAYDGIPVLFLSSAYEGRDLQNGIQSGADYYMAKPFHAAELRRVVAACIERKLSKKD